LIGINRDPIFVCETGQRIFPSPDIPALPLSDDNAPGPPRQTIKWCKTSRSAMTRRGITRRRVFIVICGTLLITAAVLTAACMSAGSQSDYSRGYEIGLEAYTYGLPLIVTNTTFTTMTSIDVSSGAFGPVNRFNNVRSLNNAGSTVVVAPGANSLSSIAWLDLSKEPEVLHVPEVRDHFYVLALIDPYTNNPVNFGSASDTLPGDYVIAGPGQDAVPIPAGTRRIMVNYTRIWIIGSTGLKGSYDTANVTRIQDGYTLTPLSRYGTDYRPENVTNPRTTIKVSSIPGGLGFYDMLGQQLVLFPPPPADQPALARFAELGIGPGMAPSQNVHLSKDTLRGLEDAIAAGPAQIKNETRTLYTTGFDKNNGYFLGGFGQYGTDYTLRAVISQIGLGAFTPDQAIYAIGWSDHNKTPLTGSNRYVLHMAAAPPVKEGWTVTIYNLNGGLVTNPINRSQFSDTSQLVRNSDGSVDIYLQSTQPADPARVTNWLPTTPDGQGFEVMWRLLGPEPAGIPGILNGTGWQPPAITAVP
jgi:hypothetical protein